MRTVTAADLWQLHEDVIKQRLLGIRFCERLERGEFSRDEILELRHGGPPGFGDQELLFYLGKASRKPGNPLEASLHAQVTELRRNALFDIQESDAMRILGRCDETPSDKAHESREQRAREDLADIARKYHQELLAIKPNQLEAEAEAAERLLGGLSSVAPQKGTGARRKTHSPGDADALILAALRKHHDYNEGGCKNIEPIGGNQLAKLAGVAGGSVTTFWKKHFRVGDEEGTIRDYQRACVNNTLPIKLAVWSGEAPVAEAFQLMEDRIASRIDHGYDDD